MTEDYRPQPGDHQEGVNEKSPLLPLPKFHHHQRRRSMDDYYRNNTRQTEMTPAIKLVCSFARFVILCLIFGVVLHRVCCLAWRSCLALSIAFCLKPCCSQCANTRFFSSMCVFCVWFHNVDVLFILCVVQPSDICVLFAHFWDYRPFQAHARTENVCVYVLCVSVCV